MALEKLYAFGEAEGGKNQPPYFSTEIFEQSCPAEALALWEGYRGLEEYAKEVFPLEEAANGLRWMEEEVIPEDREEEDREAEADGREDGEGDSDDESEGLTIGGTDTPARIEETWLA